ncbi:5210_t:CDS:2 [Paraglomus brasilianum]|uniref:5210_t:CDS:1 n=1 Tax=Paraglomus brasilianum TaxID=144538 RepID=A0A9N9FT79_9GLOM|nr:5210_t:CDS:2 [Paraglomus brasilianum]
MATLETAHNYNPTFLGLGTQLGIAASISFYCLLQFEWNRRKKSMQYLYTPRARLAKNSSPPIPGGLFSWIPATLFLPEKFFLTHVGLDAVMYIRFLRMAVVFLAFNVVIVGAILLPLNYYGGADMKGVQALSINNIAGTNENYLWAHAVCTYIISVSWMYLLYHNYFDFVKMRKEHYKQKVISGSVSIRTVMVSRIPEYMRSEDKLKEYFESLGLAPVESARIVRHTGKLNRKIARRDDKLLALEKSHILLAKNVVAAVDTRGLLGFGNVFRSFLSRKSKKERLPTTDIEGDDVLDSQLLQSTAEWMRRRKNSSSISTEKSSSYQSPTNTSSAVQVFGRGGCRGTIWEILSQTPKTVLDKYQPTHWPGYLTTDNRVRSIDHFLKEFNHLDRRIAELRAKNITEGPYRPTSTGFVTFKLHTTAAMAAQSIACSRPHTLTTKMAPEPRDILWDNLTKRFNNQMARYLVVNLFVWALTIFWLFPILAILTLTSIDSLSKRISILGPFLEASPLIKALLQNVLPTVLVSIFMGILPWILMEISKREAFASYSKLEETVLKRYYYFSFFNVFLVFLLGITFLESIFDIINTPTSIIQILANSLPQGATFFINYIIFNTCTHGLELLQVGSQIFLHILLTTRFVSSTPRMLQRVTSPWNFQYYYYYPMHILVLVITITYSTVNPLILCFSLVYYSIAYVIFKHQFAYCYVKRYEAAGKFYRLVFRYTTDGLVIYQITVLGLIWLRGAIAPGAFLVPSVVGTLYFKFYCHKTFYSRTHYLALDTILDFREETQSENRASSRQLDYQSNGDRVEERNRSAIISSASQHDETKPDSQKASLEAYKITKHSDERNEAIDISISKLPKISNQRKTNDGFQRLNDEKNTEHSGIENNQTDATSDCLTLSQKHLKSSTTPRGSMDKKSMSQKSDSESKLFNGRRGSKPLVRASRPLSLDLTRGNRDDGTAGDNSPSTLIAITNPGTPVSDSSSTKLDVVQQSNVDVNYIESGPKPEKVSELTVPPKPEPSQAISSYTSDKNVVFETANLERKRNSSRRNSYLTRNRLLTAHDPSRQYINDDCSPYQTYLHPNLVKALNRKLWLPTDPLKQIAIEDTIELDRAITSSEGGYGTVGYWGGVSGFLGQALISPNDTNTNPIFPFTERASEVEHQCQTTGRENDANDCGIEIMCDAEIAELSECEGNSSGDLSSGEEF